MPEKFSPYPLNEKPLVLPSGHTVRFYNLIIVSGLAEPSFSVHYRSELDRNNSNARQTEAEEVIRHFESGGSCRNAKSANASICSTPAQAASKEPPEEIFQFVRNENGSWQFDGKVEPPRSTLRGTGRPPE
jgi:hypothetical protein